MTVAVEHRGTTLRFGELTQYIVTSAHTAHVYTWLAAHPGGEYVIDDDPNEESLQLGADLRALAARQASEYVLANPDARIVGAPPHAPGMWDG